MATLYFNPQAGNWNIGDSIPVDVFVQTDENVNAAQVNIKFTADMFLIENISYIGSDLPIQAEETKLDDVIKMARAVIGGGTGQLLFAKLFVLAKKNGVGKLEFDETSAVVRSSDATNVLQNRREAVFTISDVDTLPPAPIE